MWPKRRQAAYLLDLSGLWKGLSESVAYSFIMPISSYFYSHWDNFQGLTAANYGRRHSTSPPNLLLFVPPTPWNVHSSRKGNTKLPGIMAVGYIAAFSETLALAVIVSKGVAPLKDVSSMNDCTYVVQSLSRRESLRV